MGLKYTSSICASTRLKFYCHKFFFSDWLTGPIFFSFVFFPNLHENNTNFKKFNSLKSVDRLLNRYTPSNVQ